LRELLGGRAFGGLRLWSVLSSAGLSERILLLMIHPHDALLRHAKDFFLQQMVGLFVWDQVLVAAPERVEAIAPNVSRIERRRLMQEREGRGRYHEMARMIFPLPKTAARWEILIYSSMEKPPLGEVMLRDYERSLAVVAGPLDPATWVKIGNWIKSNELHQRKAS